MKISPVLLAAAFCLPSVASASGWRSYFKTGGAHKAAVACETVSPVVVGGTQGYSDALNDTTCFVSIDPTSTPNMIYRAFTLFSDGLFMVFNSYGPTEGSDMTSARQYYFFPRARLPHLDADAKAGTISVLMADGGRATFDPATAQIASFDRGGVTVSASLDRSVQGGVEISGYQGLLLDSGFHLGELPSSVPTGQSTFRSAQGQTCVVTNSEIFDDSNGDSVFKFDDAALSKFLKTRCPALNVGF